MPFYKIMNGQLLKAEKKVTSKDYELTFDQDDKSNLPDGWTWMDNEVGSVDELDGDLGVPTIIKSWQGKRALIDNGLYDAVEEFIMNGDNQHFKVMFNDTETWSNGSHFINSAATVMNLSQEQVDQLFIQASGYTNE